MTLKTHFVNCRCYFPGQRASISGVYRVHHGVKHCDDHEVLVIRGEHFATCRSCNDNVEFSLQKELIYITHDFDFAAPLEFAGNTAARQPTGASRNNLKTA